MASWVMLSPLQVSISFYLEVHFLFLSLGFSSIEYHVLYLVTLEIT